MKLNNLSPLLHQHILYLNWLMGGPWRQTDSYVCEIQSSAFECYLKSLSVKINVWLLLPPKMLIEVISKASIQRMKKKNPKVWAYCSKFQVAAIWSKSQMEKKKRSLSSIKPCLWAHSWIKVGPIKGRSFGPIMLWEGYFWAINTFPSCCSFEPFSLSNNLHFRTTHGVTIGGEGVAGSQLTRMSGLVLIPHKCEATNRTVTFQLHPES